MKKQMKKKKLNGTKADVSGSLPNSTGRYVIWSDRLCEKVDMEKDRWGYYWVDIFHKCRPEDESNFGCVKIGNDR